MGLETSLLVFNSVLFILTNYMKYTRVIFFSTRVISLLQMTPGDSDLFVKTVDHFKGKRKADFLKDQSEIIIEKKKKLKIHN